MPYVRIPNAGSKGVNKDLSEHELPTGVWTDAHNVRFLDGYATQHRDYREVYNDPAITPYFLLPLTIGGDYYWIYAGAAAVYAVSGVTHTDLSGASYSGTPNSWTGAVIGGIPVLNNGTDLPIRWDTNIANNFTTLDNWPAATTCRAMRGYKNYLIALGVTKSGTEYPFMVKWSHPAVPGALPTSWDETDETTDAGEVDLAEGFGAIVDGIPLRDSFIIYRENAIHRMDYTGGPFIFRFSKVLGTSGAMNRNCVVEFDGVHFVLTNSDVIVHDGQTPRSVLDKVTRRTLFEEMDSDPSTAFVFKNPFFNEIYVCYPTIGNTSCNKALIWNYRDHTVSFRDMPSLYYGAYGPVDMALGETWDTDAEAWDLDNSRWNEPQNIPGTARVLAASADDELYLVDVLPASATEPDAYLERRGMSLGQPEQRVVVRGIRPRITGDDGGELTIKIGGDDDDPYAAPTWDATMTHTIGETIRNDCLVDRRYVAMRVENNNSVFTWRLDSLDIEVEATSEW